MITSISAYKLFHLRCDGSIGPLFINCRQRIPLNVWLPAEDHPTKGYAHRPGWHAAPAPHAPHLRTTGNDRTWCEVELRGWGAFKRPVSQGGTWYLAQQMRVIKVLGKHRVAELG